MDLDSTIGDVERLYRAVTGGQEPPARSGAVAIPPERDPVQFVDEQLARLHALLDSQINLPLPRYTPAVTIWETEAELILSFDLPGVKKSAVQVQRRGDTLIVRGVRPPALAAGETQGARLRWAEQGSGRFERQVLLPGGTSAQAKATLRDGVLEVRIPRARPQPAADEEPATTVELN